MDASKAYNQWFFVARDPETPTALPYGTVMLHGACANGSRAENFRCGLYDDTDHVRGAVLAIELWEKRRD